MPNIPCTCQDIFNKYQIGELTNLTIIMIPRRMGMFLQNAQFLPPLQHFFSYGSLNFDKSNIDYMMDYVKNYAFPTVTKITEFVQMQFCLEYGNFVSNYKLRIL